MTLFEFLEKTRPPSAKPLAMRHRGKIGKLVRKRAAELNIPVVLKEQTETFFVADYPETFDGEISKTIRNYFIEARKARDETFANEQKNLEAKAAREKAEQERLLKKERPRIPATKVYDSRKKGLNPKR